MAEKTTLRITKTLSKKIKKLADKGGFTKEAMTTKLILDGIKVNS